LTPQRSSGDRVRVVYDCMIFLQAAARGGSPAGLCLSLAEQRFVELCVSSMVLDEVGEVLRRPRLRAKFPVLTAEVVSQFLQAVKGFSTFFSSVQREFTFARDPKDEPYINLARTANARYLVSRDAHLLDVPTSSDMDSRHIREECPGLEFVDPLTFLGSIKRASAMS
jgi:putative PIN family toxin of toxin-antitoxin system